jgi:hypothetical protein
MSNNFTKQFNAEDKKRRFDLLISILKRYPYGISRKKVIELSSLKPSNLARSWQSLRNSGVIKKLGYGTFVLDENNLTQKSIGMPNTPKINLHALQIVFPILTDNSRPEHWDFVSANNQRSLIKRIDGLTIQKQTKCVQVWVWSQDIKSIKEIEQLAFSASFRAATYLYKMGVMVDIDKRSITNKHIAIEKSDLEKMIPKGTVTRVYLNREVEKIFNNDKGVEAYADIDDSPFKAIETNDIAYSQDVLMMPHYIKQTQEVLKGLVQHWNTHLPLLQSMSETQKVTQETMGAISEAVDRLTKAVEALNTSKLNK